MSEWEGLYNPVYELLYDNEIETLLAWKSDEEQTENFIFSNQVKWTRDKIEPYEDALFSHLDEGLESATVDSSLYDVFKGFTLGTNTLQEQQILSFLYPYEFEFEIGGTMKQISALYYD